MAGPAGGGRAPAGTSVIPAELPWLLASGPRQGKPYEDHPPQALKKLDSCQCPAHPCHSRGAMSTLLALSPWPHGPLRPLKAGSPAPRWDSTGGTSSHPSAPAMVAGQR